jgi:tetratricopeptide (TPR) repeat protein
MIRSVSDHADKKKNTPTVVAWRQYACELAASYAVHFLKSGPIPLSTGEGPHLEGPRAALPSADPNRFAVAIAHLEHDEGQDVERLIADSLRDIEGVQILRFDEEISPEGPVPEEAEKDGHEKARHLLAGSGADVLIWGAVIAHDGRTAPRLFWTTSISRMRSRQPYIPQNLRLPEMFWEDLSSILRLMVLVQSASLFARRGRYVAGELRPFVTKIRNLLEGVGEQPALKGTSRAEVLFVCALGLEWLGEHQGNSADLRDAGRYYQYALEIWTSCGDTLNCLAAENNLGVVFGVLGTLESDVSALQRALDLLRCIVAKAPGLLPDLKASAQANLANVLIKLAELAPGTERLLEAIKSLGEALKVWVRDKFPMDWATAQNSMGLAYQLLGERNDKKYLLSAVTAHRNALEEWKREVVPVFWAQAQSNLGNALLKLGELGSSIEFFQEASAAYNAALEERTLEIEPLGWGETKNNLGTALLAVGGQLGDVEQMKAAVLAIREALTVRTRERTPMAWALTQNNLGVALTKLGDHTDQTSYLEESKVALGLAAEVWTRAAAPQRWASARNNQGDALVALGRREASDCNLKRAVEAYREALQERSRQREPFLWAATQSSLGYALYILGKREEGMELLEECVRCYRSALEVLDRNTIPFDRAGVTFKLGDALRLLGQRKNDVGLVRLALDSHAAACETCLQDSPFWAFMAARGASEDLATLTSGFDEATYRESVTRHEWIFNLLLKHDGHKIALMPIFRVVVAGKTGDRKPDFGLAPRKGDRLNDGSVVWENAGKYSYCLDCNEFLTGNKRA